MNEHIALPIRWRMAMHLMSVAKITPTRVAREDAERALDRYFALLDAQLRACGCAGFRGS